MAVLGKIRSLGPVALISVIGLALFAFVFSTGSGSITDVFKANEFNQSRVAVVNGIEMDREEFSTKVENAERGSNGSMTSIQAMNSTWNNELKNLIFRSEFEKIGLSVEREMMRAILKKYLIGYESFQDENGQFSELKLNQFIANLKEISPETLDLQTPNGTFPVSYESWNNFEESLANQDLEQLYYKFIESGLNTTIFEAKEDYFNSSDLVDFKYVRIPFNSISDSLIKVNKSDVNTYVKKNKNDYEIESSRDFIFVKYDEAPSELDKIEAESSLTNLLEDKTDIGEDGKTITYLGFKNTDDNESFINNNSAIKFNDFYGFKSSFSDLNIANKIFDLNKNELFGPYTDNGFLKITKLIDTKILPDSVKVRSISIPFQNFNNREEASKKADSVFKVFKKDKRKFNSLLRLFDPNPESTGEIEFSSSNPVINEFPNLRNFIFENRTGSVSLIEENFGFMIVEILSQGKKQKAVKIANLAVKIEPSERTRDSVYNVVSKFEIAVNKDNFREYSLKNNIKVNSANNIGELDENIPILGKERSIVRWIYEEDTQKGDIKRFNLRNGGYVVAMLTSINEEGIMPYEKSSVIALQKVKNQKKADVIINSINSLNLDEISSQNNVDVKTALSVNFNTPQIPGVGNEPAVVGYAMGIDKETTSKAIIGNSGVFYIFVTDRRKASELNNYQNLINKIKTSRSASARSGSYNALKDIAVIEDFRGQIY